MSEKILILGDIHIGARNSSKVFRQLFREYFRDTLFPLVKKQNIKRIIQLGDFFDSRNSVAVSDIDYVLNEFIPQLEETGAELYVLAGNHDVAYKNTNTTTSLSLLRTSKKIHIIDNHVETLEAGDKTFVLCPWINNENYDDLMKEVDSYTTKNHILCGHFQFTGMKMYKNSIVSSSGMDPKSFREFNKVISGHFHHPSTYGNVSYMGSVFHLTWMDADDNKYIYLYDVESGEYEPIENTNSLYTELEYHEDDLVSMSSEDIQLLSQEQFIRIYINEEYNRVELKEVINKIEKCNPLSVDVIDNTIIKDDKGPKEIEVTETKEVDEYAYEYMKDSPNNESLFRLFKDVQSEATERMKDIE